MSLWLIFFQSANFWGWAMQRSKLNLGISGLNHHFNVKILSQVVTWKNPCHIRGCQSAATPNRCSQRSSPWPTGSEVVDTCLSYFCIARKNVFIVIYLWLYSCRLAVFFQLWVQVVDQHSDMLYTLRTVDQQSHTVPIPSHVHITYQMIFIYSI